MGVHQVDPADCAREAAEDLPDVGHQAVERRGLVRAEHEGLDRFRAPREGDRHAGDHAERALREEAVDIRAGAPLESLVDPRAAAFGEGPAVDATVRQHRLQAEHCPEVIGERRDAVAPLEGVADEAARRAGAGHRDEERLPLARQKGRQHPLRDAGLERDGAELGVEVDDLLQGGQVEEHAIVASRQRAAVTPVVAGADRVERNALARGDLDDRLNLGALGGPQDGEDPPSLAGRAGRERGGRRLGSDDAGSAEKRPPRV